MLTNAFGFMLILSVTLLVVLIRGSLQIDVFVSSTGLEDGSCRRVEEPCHTMARALQICGTDEQSACNIGIIDEFIVNEPLPIVIHSEDVVITTHLTRGLLVAGTNQTEGYSSLFTYSSSISDRRLTLVFASIEITGFHHVMLVNASNLVNLNLEFVDCRISNLIDTIVTDYRSSDKSNNGVVLQRCILEDITIGPTYKALFILNQVNLLVSDTTFQSINTEGTTDCVFMHTAYDKSSIVDSIVLRFENSRFLNINSRLLSLSASNDAQLHQGRLNILFDNNRIEHNQSPSLFLNLISDVTWPLTTILTLTQNTYRNNSMPFASANLIGVVSMTGNEFTDNMLDHRFLVNFHATSMQLTSNYFERNYAIPFGIRLVGKSAELYNVTLKECSSIRLEVAMSSVDNCSFINNVYNGALFIDKVYMAQHTVSNSTFVDNRSDGNGGAMIVKGADLISISDCVFTGNVAASGGAIYFERSDVLIQETYFYRNRAAYGGCVTSLTSTMTINDVVFSECSTDPEIDGDYRAFHGGALSAVQGAIVQIARSSFMNNRCGKGSSKSGNGGAIYLKDSDFIPQPGASTFFNNTAQNGGAIYISWGMTVLRSYVISASLNFFNNTAENMGGAGYIGGNLEISFPIASAKSIFIGNVAQYGGALVLDDAEKGSGSSLMQFFFQENRASQAGGAIYTLGRTNASRFSELNIVGNIRNDAGGYGDFIATETDKLVLNYAQESHAIYPDQKFPVHVTLLDHFQQIIRGTDNSIVALSPTSNRSKMKILGQLQRAANKRGVASFTDLSFEGKIGSDLRLKFYLVQNPSISAEFVVHLTPCDSGYQRVPIVDQGQVFDTCEMCPYGSYSIVQNASTCYVCPSRASCHSNRIVAEKGYWATYDRNSERVVTFFCTNGYCSGGNNCTDNRDSESPICGACKSGYSEWAGKCLPCNKRKVDGLYLALFIFFIFGIFLFNHMISQHQKSNAATKIMFFFIQTLSLMISFGSFGGILQSIFSFQPPVVSIKRGGVLHCPFNRSGYGRFMSDFLQQIVLLIMLLSIFLFSRLKLVERVLESLNHMPRVSGMIARYSPEADLARDLLDDEQQKVDTSSYFGVVKQFVASIPGRAIAKFNSIFKTSFRETASYFRSAIHFLIVTYQGLTLVGISFFSCQWFGDSYRVSKSVDIVCLSRRYNRWAFLYGLIVAYALLFPIALVVFLVRYKTTLWNDSFKKKYGCLYIIYKPYLYWYEGFALYRRTIIVAIVALTDVVYDAAVGRDTNMPSRLFRHILLGVAITAFLLIQRVVKPFVNRHENYLEEISLATLATVAWLQSAASISNNSKGDKIITVFIVLVLAPSSLIIGTNFVIHLRFVAKAIRRARNLWNSLKGTKQSVAADVENETEVLSENAK